MNPELARETLSQLKRYTLAACRLLGVNLTKGRRNHSGVYAPEQPQGLIYHYTASNAAIGPRRPYGRLPVMLSRLRPYSGHAVGCHVVVWDMPMPRLAPLKARYPLLQAVPSEVFFFGDDRALWHAGSANRWSLGIEVRNCGELHRSSRGAFFWNRGQYRYRGREPIEIGSKWWEPFTYSQMLGTLWISRLFAQCHPIVPHRVLGHTQVSSTRIDPGPHFPLHEMREAACLTPDIPLLEVPFLGEFQQRYEAGDEQLPHDDPFVSEESLHQGLYRHDWDGEFTLSDVKVEPVFNWEERVGDQPNARLVQELKKTLRRLGYYPGEWDDSTMDQAFVETVALFQGRWKKRMKRRGRRRWVQATPITGKVDDTLVQLVEQFDRQQYRMVS